MPVTRDTTLEPGRAGTPSRSRARAWGGRLLTLWRFLRQRVYSEHRAVGLRRDLQRPFATPEAKVPIGIRLLTEEDRRTLASPQAGESEVERFERRSRMAMLEAGLQCCYAAADAQDQLCYVQWLLTPEQNPRLQAFFRGSFPWLASDEALLEGAFTPASRRGLRIMPCAMAQLALKAQEAGVRWVLTFVSEGNEASLKGCRRAGFEPYVLRRATWRLFRHRYRFEPLPQELPQRLPTAVPPQSREPPRTPLGSRA
jgi:hypothetical protein